MVGKPVQSKPRNASVILRVLEEEAAAWKRAAAREDLSLSAWLRRLANAAVKKPKASRR